MKKNVGLGMMAASILAVGVAHAGIGMQIETERDRRRRKEMDDLFANDPVVTVAGADFSSLEERVLAHHAEAVTEDLERRTMSAALGLPFDESHQIKSGTLTGEEFKAAMEPEKPRDDEPMPDRFSVNPDSPFYDKRWASVRIGVRFDGSDRPGDVEEYCVSEGWIRVQMFMKNGKVKRERGKIVCLKRHGKVEPYRK